MDKMTEYNDAMYIDELRKRIEELEKERDFWAKTAKGYKDDYNKLLRTGKGRVEK
jgi:hypothetical protein